MTVKLLLLALPLSFWTMVRGENPLEPITISLQVIFYSIPYYVSFREGNFLKLGLNVTNIFYPSGPPQIQAAVVNKSWDAGSAGIVPNILGGSHGLLNIAITSDQSAVNQLVGLAAVSETWPIESLEGVTIAVTANSTAHYVVQACLKDYNLSQAKWLFVQQDACVEALHPKNGSAPTAQLGGLWAPNTYRVLDHSNGSKSLCSGETVYKKATSALMVRQEYAEAKPDIVTKLLAGWLRGIAFVKNATNRNQVLAYMSEFYTTHGLNLSQFDMEQDLDLFGLFPLEEQLKAMTRSGTPPSSNFDFWTTEVGEFLVANKVMTSYPEPQTYITDKFLQYVNNNPTLKSFARGEDVDVSNVVVVTESTTATSNVATAFTFAGAWMILMLSGIVAKTLLLLL